MDLMQLALMKKMGGGSGGASSWNDLKDKPFYKADEQHCFVDNKSYTSKLETSLGVPVYYVGLLNALDGMHKTKPCTITWDGITREHSPVDLELLGMKFTAYGNIGFFASFGVQAEDTGEPYVLVCEVGGTNSFFTMDTAEKNHVISIMGETVVVHQMAQEYIEIPTFDLSELGLEPFSDGHSASVFLDSTELVAALYEMDAAARKGSVRLRYKFRSSDTVSVDCESVGFGSYFKHEWCFLFCTGTTEVIVITFSDPFTTSTPNIRAFMKKLPV